LGNCINFKMYIFLASVTILLLGGVLAFAFAGKPLLSTRLGVGGAVIGSILGLVSASRCLYYGGFDTISYPWAVPFGSISLGMDALSAFFLIPMFILSGLAAVYGGEYMRPWFGKKSVGAHWFFYNLLIAGMAAVVTARDGLFFLVCWEVMSLAPFFLVTFDDDKESVRQAGWTYLIAAHLGAIPLIVLFVLLGHGGGSLSFDTFGAVVTSGTVSPGTLFVLALVGFGTKAGFIPLHVWLPEAHPAAPSHVSAVMSGVMIKTGIYGIMRTLTFIGAPPLWWGITLIAVGLVSGLMGVLFATAQHDLKRLLAYSSVENVGIISLGLGVGLLGQAAGMPVVSALGYGGALLHVINHALFKGLLFMGAGAVLHSADTVQIDRLGGLMKCMPRTGFAFVVGSAAVAGLPPLNGFVGEFLVYFASVEGGFHGTTSASVAAWCAFAGLAAVGGLAAACFVNAFSSVFLGEPRDSSLPHPHEPGKAMLYTMTALASLCLMSGLFAPVVLEFTVPAVSVLSGFPASEVGYMVAGATGMLVPLSVVFVVLLSLIALLAWVRLRLLAGAEVENSVTWDCGYAAPTARMQYTASSFAQPVTRLLGGLLGTGRRVTSITGLFPRPASFETGVPGGPREYLYRPLFTWTAETLGRFRWLQHGRIHLYVLYIALTLVALLLWKL
jgi:hydrogenase-4 component B